MFVPYIMKCACTLLYFSNIQIVGAAIDAFRALLVVALWATAWIFPLSPRRYAAPVAWRDSLSADQISRRDFAARGKIFIRSAANIHHLRSGIIGRDIENEDGSLSDGDIGYIIQYDDSRSSCPVDAMELDDHYVVIPNSTTPTSQTASYSASKAYSKPKDFFYPDCETGIQAKSQCSKCRWAIYCSAVCQRAHWQQHKRECSSLALSHECMYGRADYNYNKDSMKPKPTRWDVKSVNGNKLVLEIKSSHHPCITYNFELSDTTLLEEIKAHHASSSGCSVDMQREPDGRDVITAVYNEFIRPE